MNVFGLSRYRGSIWCHRVPGRSGFITEYTRPALVAIPRKQGQGSALDPPKAEGLWKPFIFDTRSGTNVVTVDDVRHVDRAISSR
jgi:hypothetical protein